MPKQDDRIVNTFHKYFTEPQLADQSQRFFDIMITINDAHTLMLLEQGILSREEAAQLLNISKELSRNGVKSLDLVPEKEDLYLNMEAHIIRRLGDLVGGKLHIGRSRNDLYPRFRTQKR